jgi:ADP-ribose pyrophosphatase
MIKIKKGNTLDENKEVKTVEKTLIYENKWMSLHEDKIIRQDGSAGIYSVVEKRDFAVIVALIDRKMILVEQYRYPVSARYWEFPQGSWEAREISPEGLAKAELEEETGYLAAEIEPIARLFVAYGITNQAYNIFIARNLTYTRTHLDPEEVGLISREFEIEEVEKMILSGQIKDASTVAVFGLLRMKHLI